MKTGFTLTTKNLANLFSKGFPCPVLVKKIFFRRRFPKKKLIPVDRAELESNGVRVILGKAVQSIEWQIGNLHVHTASGETETADMVLVATRVRPSSKLAQAAGIASGFGGALKVDRTMATNVADIWTAGDCAETWDSSSQSIRTKSRWNGATKRSGR